MHGIIFWGDGINILICYAGQRNDFLQNFQDQALLMTDWKPSSVCCVSADMKYLINLVFFFFFWGNRSVCYDGGLPETYYKVLMKRGLPPCASESFCLSQRTQRFKIYTTVILPIVLYGCETRSLTLRNQLSVIVFEKRALRRMF